MLEAFLANSTILRGMMNWRTAQRSRMVVPLEPLLNSFCTQPLLASKPARIHDLAGTMPNTPGSSGQVECVT